MKRVLTGLVTGALGAGLVLGGAGTASAALIADYTDCPADRQVVTRGNALGWVWVNANDRIDITSGSSKTRVYGIVRAGVRFTGWSVSSGVDDDEWPRGSGDCSVR